MSAVNSTIEGPLSSEFSITTQGGGIDSYAKLVLHSEDFTDSSPAPAKTITNYGATVSSAQKKFGTNSLYFNGSSYISIPSSTDFDFGSNNFTIDFWMYLSSLPSGTSMIIERPTTGNDSLFTFEICVTSAGSMDFVSNAGAGHMPTLGVASGTITAGVWNHIAVTRNGNAWTFWVNGTSRATATADITVVSSTKSVDIGRERYTGGINYLTGYIDELRISKGTARWTSTFTPPTRPYSN